MKHIAILMTCHNRAEKTSACLQSLYACSVPIEYILTIFLVDDGSTDNTFELVSAKYPKVNIIKGDGNLYWNGGMYLAWQTAKKTFDFDYYLLLNDDTILFNFAISELIECQLHNINNFIVCGAFQSSLTREFSYGGRKIDNKAVMPNGQIQYCSKMNGNSILVSRHICNTIGLLDPIYPHAIGDYDYGFRAIKNGFNIITTRAYIGTCESNISLPKWCNSYVSLPERLNNLYSPLGKCHPKFYFIYEKRHFGYLVAVKHFISIHLRVMFPKLWG